MVFWRRSGPAPVCITLLSELRNHFHTVLETPNANLVEGMLWFLKGVVGCMARTTPPPFSQKPVRSSNSNPRFDPFPIPRRVLDSDRFRHSWRAWVDASYFPARFDGGTAKTRPDGGT
jgi:hypothetical protein